MAIKPIRFNTEMVRAILEGRKTQTRRIVKGIDGLNVYRAEPSEDSYESLLEWDFFFGGCLPDGALYDAIQSVKAPFGIGDILWVRETFLRCFKTRFLYKADDSEGAIERAFIQYGCNWKPSIHMPKEAARIFLRVKDVRVERLQECGNGWCFDIEKEGVVAPQDPILYINDDYFHDALRKEFKGLWDGTIKKADLPCYGWDANPWVWVIEFERCEEPKGWYA